MAERVEVETFLQQMLRPEAFKDYGPNGLQAAHLARHFGLEHSYIEVGNPA